MYGKGRRGHLMQTLKPPRIDIPICNDIGEANMRVKVEHNRTKAAAIESVDRSFNEMFQEAAGLPVRIVVKQKGWQGSTLSFQLSAKLGLLSSPIKGTVEVTDSELIIDADLGMLNRLLPEKTIQDAIGSRVKGFLN